MGQPEGEQAFSRRERHRRAHPVRPKTYDLRKPGRHVDAWVRTHAAPDKRRHLPQTRAECIDEPRPCPYATCRFHLAIDIKEETGNLTLVFPDVPIDRMVHTCALDIAESGGATLEEVGALLNMTRERVRQIEMIALAKVELRAKRF